MTETLEVKPEIGTEAWVHQNHIDILMDQGWHFRVSGYNEGYCKVEIVGRSTGSIAEEEEETEREETEFEPFVCDHCGNEYGPEDYETRAAAQAALAGHTNIHNGEEDNEGGQRAGQDVLFDEEEAEA